jgi:hypothetical protein
VKETFFISKQNNTDPTLGYAKDGAPGEENPRLVHHALIKNEESF